MSSTINDKLDTIEVSALSESQNNIVDKASSDIVSADNLIPTGDINDTVNNGITDDLKSDDRTPIEPSNSEPMSLEPEIKQKSVEPKPFEGRYNIDRLVVRDDENKTEYRYFGEIKITGEDALVIKKKLNIQFYFALQVRNKKNSSNVILEIRQADIFCDNWILLMCFSRT